MTRTVAKVAVVGAVSLAMLVLLTLQITNVQVGRDTYELSAVFDDVTGLFPGDPVKIAGIDVGSIESIDTEDGKARVTFVVDESRRLPAETVASIRWRDVLGLRFLYLEPPDGAPGVGELLAHGDEVTATQSVVDVNLVFDNLGPLINALDPEAINRLVANLDVALGDNVDELRGTFDDVATFAGAVDDHGAQLGSMVDNLGALSGAVADRDAQIRTMLENLAALTRTVADDSAVVDEAVVQLGALGEDLSVVLAANRGNIDDLLADVASLLDVVDANLDDVEKTLDQLDEFGTVTNRATRFGRAYNRGVVCIDFDAPPCPTPIGTNDWDENPLDDDGKASIDELVRILTGEGGDQGPNAPEGDDE